MLQSILESVRVALPPVAAAMGDWEERAAGAPPARDFEEALRRPGIAVIAEIKRRSPSAGVIGPQLDAAHLAREYEAGGASAISVVTEPDHFGGSVTDLTAVRDNVELPILRKDFVLHPAQVAQARAHGADAVLLIVAILRQPELETLIRDAHRLGMAAVVEAHDADEIERAASAGARIVGINNRDLDTFEVDLTTAERLSGSIPTGLVRVAESGISDADAVGRMIAAGYDAVLVGQAAVEAADKRAFIQGLVGR